MAMYPRRLVKGASMSFSIRRLLLAVTLVVSVSLIGTATNAIAAPVQKRSLEQKYTDLRVAVKKRYGVRTAGRNIRRQGIRTPKGRVIEAEPRHLARSIRTYRRWLAPPAPVAKQGDRISAAPQYAGGKWAIPAPIVMCESGGNYRAVNKGGSGAGGAYQIMPSTWAAHGGKGLPQNAPPAEQDGIAGEIWNGGAGRSQWSC